MSRFLKDAEAIFEAAETAAAAGHTISDYTILLGTGSGVRLIANSDWPLASLEREYSADAAYRVSSASGQLSVDGRNGNRSVHLEATPMATTARALLNSTIPGYMVTDKRRSDGFSGGAGRF